MFGTFSGHVYALNAATGTKVWRYTTGAYVGSSPAVANGVVYIGSNDFNIYALNAATGAELWRYTTGFSVEAPAAVANGVLYAGSVDGNMYAFRLPSEQAAPGRPKPGQLHPNYALRAPNATRA